MKSDSFDIPFVCLYKSVNCFQKHCLVACSYLCNPTGSILCQCYCILEYSENNGTAGTALISHSALIYDSHSLLVCQQVVVILGWKFPQIVAPHFTERCVKSGGPLPIPFFQFFSFFGYWYR